MKDPALVEAIRQIALLNAEIATLRAEIEAEHNALGRLGIATLESATLRAALDLCVETIRWTEGFVLDDAMETWKRGTRAALAKAKEAARG
jgi:hypothetical protein